jgi:hypothetical protein
MDGATVIAVIIVIVSPFGLKFQPGDEATSHEIWMDGGHVVSTTSDVEDVEIPKDGELHQFHVRAIRGDEFVDGPEQDIQYAVNTDLDGNGKTYFPDFVILGAAFNSCNDGVQVVECPEPAP